MFNDVIFRSRDLTWWVIWEKHQGLNVITLSLISINVTRNKISQIEDYFDVLLLKSWSLSFLYCFIFWNKVPCLIETISSAMTKLKSMYYCSYSKDLQLKLHNNLIAISTYKFLISVSCTKVAVFGTREEKIMIRY